MSKLRALVVFGLLGLAGAAAQVTGYAPSAALDQKGHAGLTLALAPGLTFCNGAVVNYGGGTLAMAASATNLVYLDTTTATCAPGVKTGAFAASDWPLAEVTTSATAITGIQNVSTPVHSNRPAAFVTPAGLATLAAFHTTQSGNLLAAPAASQAYRVNYYAWQAASGSGGTCATSATVTLAFTWADPSGTAQTKTLSALSLPPTLAGGAYQSGEFSVVTASGTAIAYTATWANGNCTTQPTAQAQLWLETVN